MRAARPSGAVGCGPGRAGAVVLGDAAGAARGRPLAGRGRGDRDPRVRDAPGAGLVVVLAVRGGFQPVGAWDQPGGAEGGGARPSARAAPIKPIESERPRALTGLVGQSLAQRKARPLDIAPLSAPMAPISSTPLTASSPTPAAEVARTAARPDTPSLSIDELRALLASPKRLREVALLGELLQPPVSLRPPRRPR